MKLFNLPNILTLGNLTSGCLAIFTTFSSTIDEVGKIKLIAILVSISLLLDFLDGMVARALNIKSDLGKELDSLADVVSFGLVPTCIFLLLFNKIDFNCTCPIPVQLRVSHELISIAIVLFSALRLAKFNIDETQASYFRGLATPANTILILSVALTRFLQPDFFLSPYFGNSYFLIGLIVVSCFLLISNIPMFSFKINGFGIKKNDFRYIFLLATIVLLFSFQFAGLFLAILCYILLSLVYKNKIIHS